MTFCETKFIAGTVETTSTPVSFQESFTVAASATHLVTLIMRGIYVGRGYEMVGKGYNKANDDNRY
jgi:hypothetical protein